MDASSATDDDARESRPRRSFAEINAESTCQEVHATEASYVEDMRLMLTTYERPARILCLTLEQKNAIFSNIEGLLQCNRELLRHLEADGDPVEVLARAFLAVAPFFRLYAEYVMNYQKALATVEACRRSSEGFAAFLTAQQTLPETRGLSLESLLIKPVQRITKYPLFFKDLARLVPPTLSGRRAGRRAATRRARPAAPSAAPAASARTTRSRPAAAGRRPQAPMPSSKGAIRGAESRGTKLCIFAPNQAQPHGWLPGRVP